MSEYAIRKLDNVEVKIGTCKSMYYLRFDDISKVKYYCYEGFLGCMFRLPFSDEDDLPIGQYENYNRSVNLVNYTTTEEEQTQMMSHTGIIQCHHQSGILINMKCYHGFKLPEGSQNGDIKTHWNGRHPNNLVLSGVKYTAEGLLAVISCKWCNEKWITSNWDSIISHVSDKTMRNRLTKYANIKF